MVALGTNIQPCILSYIVKYSSSDIGVCQLVCSLQFLSMVFKGVKG